MQKYKIVASKSQKRYTLILSADSESEAKEKLHKEGYSILTVSPVENATIEGNKFLFQIEKEGEIKNGVIIWDDIFKIYIKLIDELWYDVISLYPEWDEAHNNSEKQKKIIDELKRWYEIQKKIVVIKKQNEESEEVFYLKKKIDEISALVRKAAEKMLYMLEYRQEFELDDESYFILQKIYEKILHIKSSTNISKMQEIWELALAKIAEIELKSVEIRKDIESRKLLHETNSLLKKIWSDKHFIEASKDYKKISKDFFIYIFKTLSSRRAWEKETVRIKKEKKQLIDEDSYSFLKTILLLEKYKEKLTENSKEKRKNIKYFLNPFTTNEVKEGLSLKRSVIQQNISILKAKITGSIWSYTWIKRWFQKVQERGNHYIDYCISNVFWFIIVFTILFFLYTLGQSFWLFSNILEESRIWYIILLYCAFFAFSLNKWIFSIWINIVFLSVIYIFWAVNF